MLLVFSMSVSSLARATPSRIIIVRHGEKPTDPSNPHLSPLGYQRADALTKLFQIHPQYAELGLPVAYFAAKFDGSNANRAVETITPLAEAYGKTVLQPYPGPEALDLANLILNNPAYDGQTVLIAWVHQKIPLLAQSLGATSAPESWDGPDVFDRVWILDFTSTGVQFSDLPESVLPGDSN